MENNKAESLDLGNERDTGEDIPIKEPWHPDKARMSLAFWVLGSILFLFLLSIFVNYLANLRYIDEELSNSLFELCRTGLLPIVTLILGYYFSKN